MKHTPRLAFFKPQFAQLMIGSKKIKDFDDVCRFAHGECGIDGLDMDIGSLDVRRMLTDQEFREQTVEKYQELGTPIIRLSSHTDGQWGGGMSEVYVKRFLDFVPTAQHGFSRDDIELAAAQRIKEGLELGNLLGFTHHQTFCGGRGIAHHDQWSTLPENWHKYEILHLSLKLIPILEVALKGNQKVGLEIGHVMQAIQTVEDLKLLRSYLPENMRHLIKWGIDTSHFNKEGCNAVEAVDQAITAGLDSLGHAKDAVYNSTIEGARPRQNALPFKDQAGKFEVFGVGTPASAKAFGTAVISASARGDFDWCVIEGEAMGEILCPFQGMKIAAENIRRVLDGKDPLCLKDINIQTWDGPTFETFAKSKVKVSGLLELNTNDYQALCEAAERVGLPRPS